MSVKLPFAVRESDGRLADAQSVPNGKACGCVCPVCKARVIAKNNGPIVAPHFAHHADCASAYETAVHEASKQIIAELGYVWLPASILGPKRKFDFTGHTLEQKFDRVVPDVMVWGDPARKLALEIFVTHAVDSRKLASLRVQRLACIEFDLSNLSRDITYAALRGMFASDTLPSKWIFNEKIENENRRRSQQRRARQAAELAQARTLIDSARRTAKWRDVVPTRNGQGYTIYHIVGCPRRARELGAYVYANVEQDCRDCRFCFGIRRKPRPKMQGGRMPPLSVLCGGHKADGITAESMLEILVPNRW